MIFLLICVPAGHSYRFGTTFSKDPPPFSERAGLRNPPKIGGFSPPLFSRLFFPCWRISSYYCIFRSKQIALFYVPAPFPSFFVWIFASIPPPAQLRNSLPHTGFARTPRGPAEPSLLALTLGFLGVSRRKSIGDSPRWRGSWVCLRILFLGDPIRTVTWPLCAALLCPLGFFIVSILFPADQR